MSTCSTCRSRKSERKTENTSRTKRSRFSPKLRNIEEINIHATWLTLVLKDGREKDLSWLEANLVTIRKPLENCLDTYRRKLRKDAVQKTMIDEIIHQEISQTVYA